MLASKGFPGHRDGGRVSHGDAVDVALLVIAMAVLLIMELHKLLRRQLSVCR